MVFVSGNVVNDGGASVTSRGVCWSTTSSPTIEDNRTNDGTGTGWYSSTIDDLHPNTKYYVRAYATNEVGTAYGEVLDFTTPDGEEVPIVVTSEVSEITINSAVCAGHVAYDGDNEITWRGVCWSTSHNPTTDDDYSLDGGPGTGNFTSALTDLIPNTKYYVRAVVGCDNIGVLYGEEVEFTTLDVCSPATGYENGYGYVDLGLPSGTKWAICNIGATSVEDFGNYYAWGEINTKDTYTPSNSVTYGSFDLPYELLGNIPQYDISGYTQYDAATANWGGNWEMPTGDELTELEDNCTWILTTRNGIEGFCVIGPNGNRIFLPNAGSYGEEFDDYGGGYWGSTSTNENWADCLKLNYSVSIDITCNRYLGRTIRPVIE